MPRVLVLLLLTGCGGGGGSPSQPASGKKAILNYSLTNSGTDPVSSVQFRQLLPNGASVPTISGSNQIDPANLVAGTAQSGVQLFGSYSAPSVVRVTVSAGSAQTITNGFSSGVLCKLSCDLPSTSTLAAKDLTMLTVSNVLAFWYNTGTAMSLPTSGVGVTVAAEVTK